MDRLGRVDGFQVDAAGIGDHRLLQADKALSELVKDACLPVQTI